jgi:hypothetical protein
MFGRIGRLRSPHAHPHRERRAAACTNQPDSSLTGTPVKRPSLLPSRSDAFPTHGVTDDQQSGAGIGFGYEGWTRLQGLCSRLSPPGPLSRLRTETANAGPRHGNGMAASGTAGRLLPQPSGAGLSPTARSAAELTPGAVPPRRCARAGGGARTGADGVQLPRVYGDAPKRAGTMAARPVCPPGIRSRATRVLRLGVLDAHALGPNVTRRRGSATVRSRHGSATSGGVGLAALGSTGAASPGDDPLRSARGGRPSSE